MSITLTTRLKRVLIAFLILVVAALPLAFMMEDFIRVAIVTPLAYEIWLIGVIIRALPQRYLLTAVLLLATYVALRSIQRVGHTPAHRRVRKRQLQGAVGLWHDRLQQIERGRYSKPRFDQLFGRLVLRILAFEHHLPMRQIVNEVETKKLPVPELLQPYAQAALRVRAPSKLTWYDRFWARLRGKSAGLIALEALTEELEPSLTYLESHLRAPRLEDLSESTDTKPQ